MTSKETLVLSTQAQDTGLTRQLKTAYTYEHTVRVEVTPERGIRLSVGSVSSDPEPGDVLTPTEARHVAKLLNAAADTAERGAG